MASAYRWRSLRMPAVVRERFNDPAYALAFARLVTHYLCHEEFLEDGVLLRNAGRLSGIPGVLVNGRYDLQAPLGNAWTLARACRMQSSWWSTARATPGTCPASPANWYAPPTASRVARPVALSGVARREGVEPPTF